MNEREADKAITQNDQTTRAWLDTVGSFYTSVFHKFVADGLTREEALELTKVIIAGREARLFRSLGR